jgi:hypothetical protein
LAATAPSATALNTPIPTVSAVAGQVRSAGSAGLVRVWVTIIGS